jgi:hypothetical protein
MWTESNNKRGVRIKINDSSIILPPLPYLTSLTASRRGGRNSFAFFDLEFHVLVGRPLFFSCRFLPSILLSLFCYCPFLFYDLTMIVVFFQFLLVLESHLIIVF